MAVLAALALTAGLFVKFVQLERRGRSATVLYVVLGLIVFEAMFYPNPNGVPNGLFHPGTGGFNFRLQDIVIPAALLARLLVRGGPRRLSLPSLIWTALLAWLAVAAVVGIYSGNTASLVLFEGKAIIYIGAFALALGIPTEELLAPRLFDRLIYFAAGLAAVAAVTGQAGVDLFANIPLLPLADTGQVGSDGASLDATLAVFALAVGMTRERRRLPLMLASVPLLVNVPASGQRAAMLNALVAMGILALGVVLRRGRFRATPTELSLIVLGLVAVLLVPIVARAATSTKATSLPLENTINVAFASTGKKLSAQSRVNQLQSVRALIKEQPVFGWGLGKEYTFYDPGPATFVRTNLTHNIVTDLLLRTGVFGLLLFLAATIGTVLSGFSVWRRASDDAVAAFALASTAAIVGLLTKGLVESIFEKYRLAALLGILIGFTLGAAARVFGEAGARERVALGAPAFALAGVGGGFAGNVSAAVPDRREIEAGGATRRSRLEREDVLRRRETALRAQAAQLDARAKALQHERELWDAELSARQRELRAMSGVVERLEALVAAGGVEPRPAPRDSAAVERPVDPERARELDEREARLEAMHAAFERAAGEIQQRRNDLDEREARLAQRERELLARAAAAPAPAAFEPAPAPAEAPIPRAAPTPPPAAPEPVRAGAVANGTFNVNDLERVVEAGRAANLDRADEWDAYLVQLEQHADAYGNLPPQFDGLVLDVFAELL
jgi:O-antigen ligase